MAPKAVGIGITMRTVPLLGAGPIGARTFCLLPQCTDAKVRTHLHHTYYACSDLATTASCHSEAAIDLTIADCCQVEANSLNVNIMRMVGIAVPESQLLAEDAKWRGSQNNATLIAIVTEKEELG